MSTSHPQAAAPRNSGVYVVVGVGIGETQDDDHGWSSCDVYANVKVANDSCRKAVERCKELLDRGSHDDVKHEDVKLEDVKHEEVKHEGVKHEEEEEDEEWYQTEMPRADGGIVITASKGHRVAKVMSKRRVVL